MAVEISPFDDMNSKNFMVSVVSFCSVEYNSIDKKMWVQLTANCRLGLFIFAHISARAPSPLYGS